ncbi:MAG: hypothetical protein CR982_02205 [Candidatus Cloacimonadota bacterium]|nr:MAG: hypothetical protein CR982_02205 [Candidatus Cloacimonadota bacterium]PIE81116.1 MAG: hypothetical protein CSA15_01185 [Candidatus Delongbacteria bacterium]
MDLFNTIKFIFNKIQGSWLIGIEKFAFDIREKNRKTKNLEFINKVDKAFLGLQNKNIIIIFIFTLFKLIFSIELITKNDWEIYL